MISKTSLLKALDATNCNRQEWGAFLGVALPKRIGWRPAMPEDMDLGVKVRIMTEHQIVENGLMDWCDFDEYEIYGMTFWVGDVDGDEEDSDVRLLDEPPEDCDFIDTDDLICSGWYFNYRVLMVEYEEP